MTEKTVSFVIPHKGREDLLRKTLESISEQVFDLSLVEVLIITQNSEISAEITNSIAELDYTIHTRPVSNTISKLRNYGVEKSSGKYLAFLDADVYLSQNWINCMIECIEENPSRVLVSAAQINSVHAPPLERIRTALSNGTIDDNVKFLPGRNLFLSRCTFNQTGGFPEHLITCEDYYFTDMVGQQGHLYYTSRANYIHLGEDKDYKELYLKEIWRGQSNLLSLKGRKVPLREIPSFIVPIGIFVMLFFSLTSFLLGNNLSAVIALIFFLLPFLVYSIRLFRLLTDNISFWSIIKFYLYYFPARAIGTLAGIFKSFETKEL